jgi:hypothetical protein
MVVATTEFISPIVNAASVIFPTSSPVTVSKSDQNLLAGEFKVKTGEINHAGAI